MWRIFYAIAEFLYGEEVFTNDSYTDDIIETTEFEISVATIDFPANAVEALEANADNCLLGDAATIKYGESCLKAMHSE